MAGARGIPRELAALFEPQTDQLGVRLERRGHIWVGEASGGKARGSMWLCAPTPHCLVLCHDVAPIEDMPLFEGSLGPYACACAMGGEAVACSRDCGLPVRLVRPRAKGMGRGDQVATFVERGPRLLTSRLFAGRAYRSRSIIALPGLFEELDRRYPGEFRGLFPAFGGDWDRGSKLAIERALDAIPPQPPLHPGGELELLSTVTSLMASLAADVANGDTEDGDADAEMLVERAIRLMSAAVEEGGVPPSVNDLARGLYMSRSRLCDAFKRMTGQSVGAYARRLRLERACRLLEDESLTVAEVAALLGYPSPSAFCHAFASAMGIPPQRWRDRAHVTPCEAGTSNGAPAVDGGPAV